MSFWPVVKKVMKDSDIVLYMLDVRMPNKFLNETIERMAEYYHKQLVYVINKTDLASEEHLKELKSEFIDAYFVSAVSGAGIKELKRDLVKKADEWEKEELFVGVVGYPNVGKSAIINSLIGRSSARVARFAGTTKGIQWIKSGKLMIVDSPGVIQETDSEVKIGLMGAKNPEKLKDPERVAGILIKDLLEMGSKKAIEEIYGIEIGEKETREEILEKIGMAKKFLLKGGIVDMNRTSLTLLRDWQSGKIRV